MPHTLPSRAFPRVVVAISAVALAAGFATPASADASPRPLPKLMDVPPDHPWRMDTRLALSVAEALPGRTAKRAHTMAERNLVQSAPAPIRKFNRIGPLRGHRFTVTIVGDQACAIFRPGRPSTAKAGPCVAADRIRLARPERAAATVLDYAFNSTMSGVRHHRQRVELISVMFTRRSIANLAWAYAPRGVGIAGLIDDNHDGLDDDARITLHSGGRVVCARLGVFRGERSTYSNGICKNLAPRRVHYPPGAQH